MIHAQIFTELSVTSKHAIDQWIQKFTSGNKVNKQSAVVAALTIVQQENNGILTKELLMAVANYLQIPEILVYEVATFYKMFNLQHIARYKICVCTNISCLLCNCDVIVTYLIKKLSINFGETTKDNKFTLIEAECLGACDQAPVMLINNVYYYNLTPEKIDVILASLV